MGPVGKGGLLCDRFLLVDVLSFRDAGFGPLFL
jgi:hypothetical protein